MKIHDTNQQTPLVLMADDCEVWRHLVRRALKKQPLPVRLELVADGVEAVDWLENLLAEENAELPDLICLDLNMPRMDGRDVLRWIKAHPELDSVPAVILTTSDFSRDIAECQELGCAEYVVKPIDVHEFIREFQRLLRMRTRQLVG